MARAKGGAAVDLPRAGGVRAFERAAAAAGGYRSGGDGIWMERAQRACIGGRTSDLERRGAIDRERTLRCLLMRVVDCEQGSRPTTLSTVVVRSSLRAARRIWRGGGGSSSGGTRSAQQKNASSRLGRL